MNKTYEIHSSQLKEMLVKQLKMRTDIQTKFKYLRWIDSEPSCDFYGVFDENRFQLVLYIEGRNFFTPVIKGEILPNRDGSILRYEVAQAPDMKRVYIMFATMLFLYLVSCLGVLTGASISYGDMMIFYLWPLSLAILFAVFSILNNHFTKKFTKIIFEKFSKLAG